MEEILIVILQGIAELVIQVFGSGILDLFTWLGESSDTRPSRPWLSLADLRALGYSTQVTLHHCIHFGSVSWNAARKGVG